MKDVLDFREIVLEAIQKARFQVPVFNPIAIKIQRLVASDAETRDIVQTIKLDSTLCARVLEAVNSSFYGLAVKMKTIEDAIGYMGTQQTGEVVVTASLSHNFISNDRQLQPMMTLLWKHSLCCGLAAQWVASRCSKSLSPEAFIAGVLHDFGKLRLLSAIESIKRDRRLSLPPLTDRLILDTFEALHPTQGYQLLRQMKVPEEYGLVARDHHLPAEEVPSMNELLMVVKYANEVCRTIGLTLHPEDRRGVLEMETWRNRLKVSPEAALDLTTYLRAKMRLPAVPS